MVVLVLILFDFVFPISRFGRREVICLLGVFVFCLCFCNEVKKMAQSEDKNIKRKPQHVDAG